MGLEKPSLWVVSHRGPRAAKRRARGTFEPGAAALRAFFRACDTGKPGAYFLHGTAAGEMRELACACVEADEMSLTWHAAWILFALGAAVCAHSVDGAVEYLREVDAWPKEEK